MEKSLSSILEVLLRYWGKAKPSAESAARFHLLVCHSLDVAAVASAWWNRSPAIRRAFSQALDLPEDVCKAWVSFFVASHDLGKFDLRFQLKDDEVFILLNGRVAVQGITGGKIRGFDHGKAGLYWFHADTREDSDEASSLVHMIQMEEDEAQSLATPWVEAVCGHHGFIFLREWQDDSDLKPVGVTNELVAQDRQARLAWLDACETLFLTPQGLSRDHAPVLPKDFQPFVAGFCSVCDWLGSRSEDGLFQYCDRIESLETYFEKVLRHDAPAVLKLAGIGGQVRPYSGIRSLLAKKEKDSTISVREPRQIQTLVDNIPIAPALVLVEGPTGCGKTEAALALAWRMICAGIADSIVFALPTQATSNAMFIRISQLAVAMFELGANVVLAHGKAAYNHAFADLKESARTVQASEEAWVQCANWLANSAKRAFLGQIGICTVDQVLVSVLPVKHRFVRGFGLGRSVLIVDEVHAYDTYMNTLLDEVLKHQRAAGGSAILLSATLHSAQRKRLAAAWGATCESSNEYPLLTWCPNDGTPSQTLTSKTTSPTPERKVNVECIALPELMPDDALLARVVAAVQAGAQVGIICNLVDNAQAIYRQLREMTRQPVILFHSRFTFHDRQRIEETLGGMFGPDGDRSTGRILVSTQVLEQSMDIDLDWLITQLCPVDLLFQRMGRMHRHERHHRPSGFREPLCTLIVPDDEGLGSHGIVYDETIVMWRTWQRCLKQGEQPITFPGAYREWIEDIYDEERDEAVPEWVTALQSKGTTHAETSRLSAKGMIKATRSPIFDTDAEIMAVTRDGEMSRAVIPYRDTVQGQALRDGTLVDVLSEADQGEALSLNTIPVPATWKSWLPDADNEGVHWLRMEPEDGDDSTWWGQGPRGAFRYSAEQGLQRSEGDI